MPSESRWVQCGDGWARRWWRAGWRALLPLLAAGCQAASAPPVRVQLTTDLGDIVLALDSVRAPVTVANFLAYVDGHRYDDSGTFYRALRPDNQPAGPLAINVIQGGLDADASVRWGTIPHEPTTTTGLRHRRGTISMARTAVGTASSEFFIVLADAPSLDAGGARQPDGQGFAAFGTVVQGLEVAERIQAMRTDPAPPNRLLTPVRIRRVVRLP